MSGEAPKADRAGRLLAVVLGAAVLVFVLANAHLVYVATSTQPDCVAGGGGTYRAAKPAC